jgi:hypothetical protein
MYYVNGSPVHSHHLKLPGVKGTPSRKASASGMGFFWFLMDNGITAEYHIHHDRMRKRAK